jgi:hypothetical protein
MAGDAVSLLLYRAETAALWRPPDAELATSVYANSARAELTTIDHLSTRLTLDRLEGADFF